MPAEYRKQDGTVSHYPSAAYQRKWRSAGGASYNDAYRAEAVEADREAKKARGKCADCPLEVTDDNLIVFDWDHIDPAAKTANVSALVRGGSRHGAVELVLAEIEKCELRCSNCHRLRTQREGHLRNRIGRRVQRDVVAEVLTLFDLEA